MKKFCPHKILANFQIKRPHYNRLQHMKRVITCTPLCACLKPCRHAKKSRPCLIKKASRCAADCTSKITTFFIFHFLSNTKILRENHVYLCYFIGSVVKIVLWEVATRCVLYKKVFTTFTGKSKCPSLFLYKFAGAATSLLIILTWKSLNTVYRKLMKFFKVLPKENLKSACKR